MWNEPNKRIWLNPASPETYVQRLLNPGYRAIKSVNPAREGCRRCDGPTRRPGRHLPGRFHPRMDRVGARFDAFAHHPYPVYPGDTPFLGGCACKTITMATLERLLKHVGQAFPSARIWLTEYAYQSPPDPFGVSLAAQARFIGEAARRVYAAPKVDMLIHYLYRDEPDLDRWQSGLEQIAGRAKPAYAATMLPLAQVSRRGQRVRLWGQVRPGDGSAAIRDPAAIGRRLDDDRRAAAHERGRLLLAHGGGVAGLEARLQYPMRGIASPPLIVR